MQYYRKKFFYIIFAVLENLVYFGKTHVFAFANVRKDVLEYLDVLSEFVFVSTHEICLNILENKTK